MQAGRLLFPPVPEPVEGTLCIPPFPLRLSPSALRSVSLSDLSPSALRSVSLSDLSPSALRSVSLSDLSPSALRSVSLSDLSPSALRSVSLSDLSPSALRSVSLSDLSPFALRLSPLFIFLFSFPLFSFTQDFRPYKLKQIGISYGFYQTDRDPVIANAYKKYSDQTFSFSRTYHKKWFWGPGFTIVPFNSVSRIQLTPQGKQLTPDSLSWPVEKYKSYSFSFAVFNRILIKSGGKEFRFRHPVLYLDLGIEGNAAWLFRYITESDASEFGNKERVVQSGIRRYPGLNLMARLGLSVFNVWATWRMNPFFSPSVNLPEWPEFRGGISLQIPLFKPSRRDPVYDL